VPRSSPKDVCGSILFLEVEGEVPRGFHLEQPLAQDVPADQDIERLAAMAVPLRDEETRKEDQVRPKHEDNVSDVGVSVNNFVVARDANGPLSGGLE
jgi:hypothetical protein